MDIRTHFKISAYDNGPETPEEHLKEIFEPFFSTKPTSGTGLGIVKRLVPLYGGEPTTWGLGNPEKNKFRFHQRQILAIDLAGTRVG